LELPLFQQPVCRHAARRWLQLVMQALSRIWSVSFAQLETHICCSPLHFIGSAAAVPQQSSNAPAATTTARMIWSVMRAKTV
jgi:hypothetical protein